MSERTQIVQCFLPNLVAGEYEIVATQDIKRHDSSIQHVEKTMNVGVDAARFTLGNDDIYSVYPPANTTGDYKNHLPHIVFNRRTLPWERTIDGQPPKNQDVDNPIPWMALLLFNEEDMKNLKIEQTALKEVLNTNQADDITRPEIEDKTSEKALRLMPWENIDQKCLTIDLSKEQCLRYLPANEDLTYLAHSKIVAIDHKDPNGIGDVAEKKSDVAGKEGYFSVLIGNRIVRENQSYTAIVVSLEGHKNHLGKAQELREKVRMVVLANWSFHSFGETSFETLLKGIEVQSMTLHPTLKAGHILEPYTKHGYVPMRHQMRNGAKNISWYRGPFVPNRVDFERKEYIKFSSSDTALYYDKTTGFLDVSIAAAWELGKIMALNNQEFTKAIVTWNNAPVVSDTDVPIEIVKKSTLVQWLNNDKMDLAQNQDSIEQYREFPAVVKSYLTSLAKLEGLPLSYLIPEQKYISNSTGIPNALTMFYLNPYWIWALLDGAVSLSRELLTDTVTQVKGIVDSIFGAGIINGFLFHSPIVSGWRGIEIKAFDRKGILIDNNQKIRFERITPDIFLGVFRGEISEIVITQPYEGLHFGIKEKDVANQIFEKAIKNDDGKISEVNKIEINDPHLDKISHVLLVNQLAEKLTKATQKETFTSAEYAYQMIDSPIEATFKIQYKEQP